MADTLVPLVATKEMNSPYDFVTEFIVKSGVTIYQGAAVAVGSDGNLNKPSALGAQYALGVAQQTVVGDGVERCRVQQGVFRFDNDAGNLLSIANRLGPCYFSDDHTVGTDSSKLLAGIVIDVRTEGVYVLVGAIAPASAQVGALLAANNLNDVADAAASLENLGVGLTDTPTFAGLNVTGSTHAKRETFTPTANLYTVLNASGDQTVRCGADTDVVQLPDIAAGNKGMRVTVLVTAADGGALVSLSPHSSDKIVGTVANAAADSVASGVADKDFQCTKATQNKGDYVTVESDGTDTWYIVGGVGIWASAA